eukprot:maker-scaffold1451_size40729-snap-gene-0.2 protein:Tk09613 transcript:maker-scaffold1451_size40729-snap-gene-0.2-mRNA-1 annotation:"PREDICTED: uncharacterized protein LOC100902024"
MTKLWSTRGSIVHHFKGGYQVQPQRLIAPTGYRVQTVEVILKFLEVYCKQPVPGRNTLTKVIDEETKEQLQKIKAKLSGKDLCIQVDETTDRQGRSMTAILASPLDGQTLDRPFIIDCVDIITANNVTLQQAVIKSLSRLFGDEVDFNKLRVFLTDGAPYCIKAGLGLKSLCPNMLHITCLAHGVNRVAELARVTYPKANRLISEVKKKFVKSSHRKRENLPLSAKPPCLLSRSLRDGAPYCIKASLGLKSLCPNMLHITCLAHGVNRVAELARVTYPKANRLISEVKKFFVKSSHRKREFATFCKAPLPPEPGTWLKAAFYYTENFAIITQFIEGMKEDAQSIIEAKKLFKDEEVMAQLTIIRANFQPATTSVALFATRSVALFATTTSVALFATTSVALFATTSVAPLWPFPGLLSLLAPLWPFPGLLSLLPLWPFPGLLSLLAPLWPIPRTAEPAGPLVAHSEDC